MIRISLDDTQARRLEQAFLQATDRKTRDRLQVVGMAHRGRSHQHIAADPGVSPRTVQRWLNAYLRGGLAALTPRKAKAHPTAIPPHLASLSLAKFGGGLGVNCRGAAATVGFRGDRGRCAALVEEFANELDTDLEASRPSDLSFVAIDGLDDALAEVERGGLPVIGSKGEINQGNRNNTQGQGKTDSICTLLSYKLLRGNVLG